MENNSVQRREINDFKQLIGLNNLDAKLVEKIKSGDVGKVRSYIEKKRIKYIKNEREDANYLHLACDQKKDACLAIVVMLIGEYGHDAHDTVQMRGNCLNICSQSGSIMAAKYILSYPSNQTLINKIIISYTNFTPLHSAAYNHDLDLVQLLIKKKADINMSTNNNDAYDISILYGNDPLNETTLYLLDKKKLTKRNFYVTLCNQSLALLTKFWEKSGNQFSMKDTLETGTTVLIDSVYSNRKQIINFILENVNFFFLQFF